MEYQKSTIDKSKDISKVVKTWDSQMLFEGAQLVEIKHGADVYQLRVTKAGKLILTK